MKKIIYLLAIAAFLSCQSGNKNTKANESATEKAQIVQTTVNIGGMDCDMCVKSVEKGVNQLAGIESVAVSLNDSNAVIKYDANKVQLAEIEKAIEKRGYSVKGEL